MLTQKVNLSGLCVAGPTATGSADQSGRNTAEALSEPGPLPALAQPFTTLCHHALTHPPPSPPSPRSFLHTLSPCFNSTLAQPSTLLSSCFSPPPLPPAPRRQRRTLTPEEGSLLKGFTQGPFCRFSPLPPPSSCVCAKFGACCAEKEEEKPTEKLVILGCSFSP